MQSLGVELIAIAESSLNDVAVGPPIEDPFVFSAARRVGPIDSRADAQGGVVTASTLDHRSARIDAARALAIGGVVLVHTTQVIPGGGLPGAVGSLAGTGRYGVQLFFVISGFLLARLYSAASPWIWRSFALRRFGRIYPLYFVFVAFWGVVALIASPHAFYFDVFVVIATLLLLNDLWWTSAWGFVPGAWSISAEAINYLLYPLVRQRPLRVLVLILILLTVISTAVGLLAWIETGGTYRGDNGALWSWANTFAPWNTIPFFLSGVLLARCEEGATRWLTRFPQWPLVATGVALFGVVVTAFVGSLTPVALLFVSLAFAVVVWSRWNPPRWVQWIGRRSYGTYFCHFVLLAVVESWLLETTPLEGPAFATILLLGTAAGVLFVSSMMSQVLWVVVERRGIAWSRRAAETYTQPPSA